VGDRLFLALLEYFTPLTFSPAPGAFGNAISIYDGVSIVFERGPVDQSRLYNIDRFPNLNPTLSRGSKTRTGADYRGQLLYRSARTISLVLRRSRSDSGDGERASQLASDNGTGSD
jgi:hypothetical protein